MVDAKISIRLSRPKPASATEPALIAAAMITAVPMTFHLSVAYSR